MSWSADFFDSLFAQLTAQQAIFFLTAVLKGLKVTKTTNKHGQKVLQIKLVNLKSQSRERLETI